MNHYDIKDILKLLSVLVLTRGSDVDTLYVDKATVDINTLSDIEVALSEFFELASDEVNFNNIDLLIERINTLEVTVNAK